jgi:sugar phosphate permease
MGTSITGVAVAAVALAPSYGVMLLLLVCSGLGCGFIYPAAVKAIMLWFPPQERATAVGINQSAVNVSGMLGAAIMPALALSFGWMSGFLAAGVLALLACGVALLLYRDPAPAEHAWSLASGACGGLMRRDAGSPGPRAVTAAGFRQPIAEDPSQPAGNDSDRATTGDSGEADANGLDRPSTTMETPASVACVSLEEQGIPCVTGDARADQAAVRPGFRAVVRSRDILLMGFAALLLCMVEFAALAHLVLFLQAEWAYTAVAAGGLLAFCQAAGAAGKPLSGLASDRLLSRRRRPGLIVLSGLAGLACAALALAGAGQQWLLWLALGLLGIGAVGWGGLFGALAAETAGAALTGAASGVTAALDNVGVFAGPPLFGYIVDRTGSYAPAWWTMAGAAVAAVVLLVLVRERGTG